VSIVGHATDLIGAKVRHLWEIGTKNFCISKTRKDLWTCIYKFSEKDLAVIHETSEFYDIAFGKDYLVNTHEDLGITVFRCWENQCSVDRIKKELKNIFRFSGERQALARDAEKAELLRTRPDLVQVAPVVSMMREKDFRDRTKGWLWEDIVSNGRTYAEAIENTIFTHVLSKLSAVLP